MATHSTSSKNEVFRTNILILGKTGVGKSSLLNYLFGEARAAVGEGRPVTSQGIYEYSGFRYNGIDICIYDSWGLEPDKAEAWNGLVEDAVRNNEAKDIKDWFHTIIYCIDAQRARLESFEIMKILKPLESSGNRIMFALTKSDLASETEKKAIHELVEKHFPGRLRVEVGSVAQKLRNGTVTQQFGREDVFETASRNYGENLFCKALTHYEKTLETYCCHAKIDVLEFFEKEAGSMGVFTMYDDDFKKKIQDKARDCYRSYINNATYELEKNIKFIAKTIKIVQKAYNSKKQIIKAENIPDSSFDMDGWDNGFWEGLGGVLDFVIPIRLFWRKSGYRAKVEEI